MEEYKRIEIPLVRRIYPKLFDMPTKPMVSPGEVIEEKPKPKPKKAYRSIDDPWEEA